MEDRTDKQQTFVEMRARGNSFDTIAKKLGVSKGTLVNWSKALRQEVDNARAMEQESIIEQYQITRAHQLELLGQQLAKIKKEVAGRNFTDVPTERLITTQIKLLDAVNDFGLTVRLRAGESWDDYTGEKEWVA